jgi:hypothetical protein
LCVKFCGYDAIEYITEEEAALKSKKEAGLKFPERLVPSTDKHGKGIGK